MKTTELVALILLGLCCGASAHAQTLEWIRQFGTSELDQGWGVSADGSGNIYISGRTRGNLRGPNNGGMDAFVSKYDESGTLEWVRQLGTSESDAGWGVSADGLGNVYIAGSTTGSLDGTNAGGMDAFVSKYDESGTLDWVRQFGTSETDASWGVSADGLGNVYISGFTRGSLEGSNAGDSDAFVSKYDASGTLEWTQQLGTSQQDTSHGVSADGLGNVYISGWTAGSLEGTNAGGYDAFVSKYDASGTLEWTRQLGTSEYDASWSVCADGLGNVYISGRTDGSLGESDDGGDDAFVAKYDARGALEWVRQLGTSEGDASRGVSADGVGNVFITGFTEGGFGESNAGSYDGFLAKISDASQPLLGDVNLDGEVNGLDIDPFVAALLAGSYQNEADMNSDQVINGLDVDPFVDTVLGAAEAVPEPTTLLLVLIGVGLVAFWRQRRG